MSTNALSSTTTPFAMPSSSTPLPSCLLTTSKSFLSPLALVNGRASLSFAVAPPPLAPGGPAPPVFVTTSARHLW